jgi:hypothetical protein
MQTSEHAATRHREAGFRRSRTYIDEPSLTVVRSALRRATEIGCEDGVVVLRTVHGCLRMTVHVGHHDLASGGHLTAEGDRRQGKHRQQGSIPFQHDWLLWWWQSAVCLWSWLAWMRTRCRTGSRDRSRILPSRWETLCPLTFFSTDRSLPKLIKIGAVGALDFLCSARFVLCQPSSPLVNGRETRATGLLFGVGIRPHKHFPILVSSFQPSKAPNRPQNSNSSGVWYY